jgi:tetratricopeptide (TPR) repeat protein
LAVAATAELKDLPWETLHDGASFLVARDALPVIPVRWRDIPAASLPVANRPLRTLFMATSPEGVRPVLSFEEEEKAILEATRRHPLTLTVEESGDLTELRARVLGEPDAAIDVFHVTGHADHHDGVPVFLTEDDEGELTLATAADFAQALVRMPRLLFLSGCRTAQSPADATPSLAEAMLEKGARAVLGWARPVYDTNGVAAAAALYEGLATGLSLAKALAATYRALINAQAAHWHLLRLFITGDMPDAFVTAPGTPKRTPPPVIHSAQRFLDAENRMRVASRENFIGRRRLLQRGLKALRETERAGVLLHGMGGLGKSSLAARLCDRFGERAQPVVIFGVLDEPTLVGAIEKSALYKKEHDGLRETLRDPKRELRWRLKEVLEGLERPLLFILDDFERNGEGRAENRLDFQNGTPRLTLAAATTLAALTEVILDPDIVNSGHRVIVTSRYALDGDAGARLAAFALDNFRDADLEKLTRRLRETHRLAERHELIGAANRLADGNPRLLEWLYKVLADSETDAGKILAALAGKRAEFLESVLAQEILAQRSPELRTWLATALVYELPVAERELRALGGEGDFAGLLRRADALGLIETTVTRTERLHRVPRLLEELTAEARPAEWTNLCRRAAEALFEKPRVEWTESWATEILRLARLGGAQAAALAAANMLMSIWHQRNDYRQMHEIGEEFLKRDWRSHGTLRGLAVAKQTLGDGARARELFDAALTEFPAAAADRALTLYDFSNLLIQQGETARAAEILQADVIPFLESVGDDRNRAATLGRIADIWQAQGRLEEALRIRQEEELPVYERLNDVRSRALTLGKIADIWEAQGRWEEALRIRQEEELPVYERLNDVRLRAVTLGNIADIWQAQGRWEEALRIRQEEQLPVYDRLNDVRSRAVTLGKIADIWQAQGRWEEALRIRQEEELPVYERLNDVHQRAVTLGKIADIRRAQGRLEEALRIRQEEELPVYERLNDVRSRAVTLGKIADIWRAQGRWEEALRILQDELSPVFEGLNDVRSRAVTLGNIADIWQAQGRWEEALRIRQEEELPVYERLNDVHQRAVTLGRIADIWQAQGRLEEALRIRQEEELPVYERLNDVRERAVTLGKIADIWEAQGRWEEALRIRQEEELPVFERLNDVRSRAVTLGKIADIRQAQGRLEEALPLYEEALRVHHGMNDIHSVAHVLARIAQVLSARGDFTNALDCLGEAEEIFAHLQSPDVEAVRQLTMETQMMMNLTARLGDAKTARLMELLQAGDGEAASRFLQLHLGDGASPAD